MKFLGEIHIDFIGLRKIALFLSGGALAIGIISIVLRGGLGLGLDFTGGLEIHFKFKETPSISKIRSALAKIDLSKAVIQQYGSRQENLVLVRCAVEEISQEIASNIIGYRERQGELTDLKELRTIRGIEAVGYENLLGVFTLDSSQMEKIDLNQATEVSLIPAIRQIFHRKTVAKIEEVVRGELGGEENAFAVQSIDIIGPKVSQELQRKAYLAIIFALSGMLIYITWRFELRFAVGALTALVHDVFISLGALSLANFDLSLPVIAALLTIIGYSLNDTIVVYDRIRENLKTHRKGKGSLKKLLNLSINQSLSRTIITSLTTLIVVVVLFVWGGSVIHSFTFVLLVGIIVGTYSSDFIATPVVYSWARSKMRRE